MKSNGTVPLRARLAALDPFRPRDPAADALALLACALILTGFGLVCVYSFGQALVVRQALWAIVAVAACLVVSRLPSDLLRRCAPWLLAATGVLLAFALLFAPEIKGTRRWLVLGGVGQFQPSELAKVAVVLFLATRLAVHEPLRGGLLRLAWPVALVALLVLAAPDLGTAMFLCVVTFAMLLIAGARLGRVVLAGLVLLPVIALVAAHHPYMRERLAFFSGHYNHQQVQALLALGSGGLLGNGLGAGRQKMAYLPEGHTDYVFSNIGEELGFLGVVCVGLLFALVLIYGVRVALAAERRGSRFGFHLACGGTFVVVFQAVVNIAVATAAAPTKGISLPFLSHGGSNLLVSFLAIGLVVQVGRSLSAEGPASRPEVST